MDLQGIVAQNIKNIRNLHNHSLKFLSIRTGIDPTRINKMENNKANINIKILEIIAKYYNVNICFFFIKVQENNVEKLYNLMRDSQGVCFDLDQIEEIVKKYK